MRNAIAALLVTTGLSAMACDRTDPAPVQIATVEIAGRDTLTYRRASVRLTAILRDARGDVIDTSVLRGRAVSWTSDHSEVWLSDSGAAVTIATWTRKPRGPNPYEGITRAWITARIDGATASTNVVVCPAYQVAAHNSAILVRGRTSPLPVWVIGPSFRMFSSARWTSSNPAVVSVDGEVATANAVGTATLAARACDYADTVDVRVVPAGYDVTYLGDDTEAVDLNDAGQVLGVSGRAAPARWLWQSGVFTAITGCESFRLNNRGTVLCREAGPTMWRNGVVTRHDTLSYQTGAFNDSGFVVMRDLMSVRNDAFLWRAAGRVDSLGGIHFYHAAEAVNNAGDVSGRTEGLYGPPIVRFADGTVRRLHPFGRGGSTAAINDSGDVVGHGEGMTGPARLQTAAIWKRSGNGAGSRPRKAWPVTNIIATAATGINNKGEVVGSGEYGGFVLTGGRVGLLSELVPPQWRIVSARDINIHGHIIGQAVNTETGKSGAVLLKPLF